MRAVSTTKDDDYHSRPRAWPEAAPDPLEAPELYDGIRFKRLIAYAIDLIIITLLMVGLWVVGSFFAIITLGLLYPVLAAAAFVLPFAYHTLLIGGAANATVGMRMMDLRVVAWNGHSPSYAQAAMQTFLFYASLAFATFWFSRYRSSMPVAAACTICWPARSPSTICICADYGRPNPSALPANV